MNFPEQMTAQAINALQAIVSKEVNRVESTLKGTNGEDKKNIVKISVVKILEIIYDLADNSLNCPALVDTVAKETLIPIIADLIDESVKNFNLFGWIENNGL